MEAEIGKGKTFPNHSFFLGSMLVFWGTYVSIKKESPLKEPCHKPTMISQFTSPGGLNFAIIAQGLAIAAKQSKFAGGVVEGGIALP